MSPLIADRVEVGGSDNADGGSGSLSLSGGAEASVQFTLIAPGPGARTSLLSVDGFGTSYATRFISLGSGDGRGVVRASDGALVDIENDLGVGSFFGGSGVFEIDGFAVVEAGTGSLVRGRGEVVGGGLLDIRSGLVQLGNGGSFDLSVAEGGELRAGSLQLGSPNGGVGSTLTLGDRGVALLGAGQVNAGSELRLAGGGLTTDFVNIAGGALVGSGKINGEVRLADGAGSRGRVTLESGETLTVQRGGQSANAITSRGVVENAGTLDLGGSVFVNDQDGSYLGRGGTLRASQFQNEGADAAVDLVAGDNVFDAEVLNSQSRRVTVTGGATAVFQKDFRNQGSLRIDNGSRATFVGDYAGNLATGGGESVVLGNLSFSAQQRAVVAFSTVVTGAAVGQRNAQPLSGTLDLRSSGSSLELNFGADNSFDAVDFTTAEAVLRLDDTELILNRASGFSPENGDRFQLFGFFVDGESQIEGSFAISPEDLALGGGLFFDASELESTGFLTVIPEPGSVALLLGGAGLLLRRRRVG